MISKNLEKIINDQMNFEFYSSYLYLSMVAQLRTDGLNGFANWMQVQTEEELIHGMGFYNFLIQRGGKVALKEIAQPASSWKSPLAMFENAYKHEQIVTSRIHNIAAMAEKEKDYALLNFIQWYISEQVEEEANAVEIINQLKMIGDAKSGLFLVDKELAQRAFVMPVIPGGITAAQLSGGGGTATA